MKRLLSGPGLFILCLLLFTGQRLQAADPFILNPGFESGSSSWSQYSSGGFGIIVNGAGYNGSNWYAYLGGYDNADEYINQNVTIPGDAGSATLSFAYNIFTEEVESANYDLLSIEVADPPANTTKTTIAYLSNQHATSGWAQSASIDLSAYKGKQIRLYFHATTDISKPTMFALDNVNLSVAIATNGLCGSNNNATLTVAPTTNLCSVGTASSVTGSGPWSWSCVGANGGSTASCSANRLSAAGKRGDCDNNGTVSIAEVQSAINMFLGMKSVEGCVDAGNDNSVSIAEVQSVINGFLGISSGSGAPAAPAGLTATASSTSQINLSWTDTAGNETGFRIERKGTGDGTFAQVGTTPANVTAFSDTGLSPATTYYYRVRAANSAGDSGYSNEASATCWSDYTPRPVVSGITSPETSGKVSITTSAQQVALSDGTSMNFRSIGQGSSLSLTLERASNTMTTGSASIATSGAMRTLTIDAVSYNGMDEISAFAPVVTIPQKELGTLDVNYVNVMRISTNPDTGLEERDFLPVFRNQNGDVTFTDWVLPADLLADQAKTVPKTTPLTVVNAAVRTVIKYSAVTIQNDDNAAVRAKLVRMVPAAGHGWKRRPVTGLLAAELQQEMKKPVQNVVVLVHGHNEMEKIGFEQKNSAEPWLFSYKLEVWNYLYDKFSSDFKDRSGSTVFYEFIYPSWRPIFTHLNGELASQLQEALKPQLTNGMKFNLFIVAHSQGGVVSRAGLMNFAPPLQDNLQRLVTWGSPHHGTPLNTTRFALSSPALAAQSGSKTAVSIIRYKTAKTVLPTHGMLDLRWTAEGFSQGESLRIGDIFKWYGDSADPQARSKWDLSSGTMLYNNDLVSLHAAENMQSMGSRYSFLYGVTSDNMKWPSWDDFSLLTFQSLSEIGQGATMNYVLMGNPAKQYMGADIGDSDGVAPVISMAGDKITTRSRSLGDVNHEQYYKSTAQGPVTVAETIKEMDFSNPLYNGPAILLTSPTSGQSRTEDQDIAVVGQLVWPGDSQPGKRITRIQVKRTSPDKSIILNDASIGDNGTFSATVKAADLKGSQAETSFSLTVIVQFKDATELEVTTTVNNSGTCSHINSVTGLMWATDANIPGKSLTLSEAKAWINGHPLICGHNDWRLPSLSELSGELGLNVWPFVNVQNAMYWSGESCTYTSYSGNTYSGAYVVFMDDHSSYCNTSTYATGYIALVRNP